MSVIYKSHVVKCYVGGVVCEAEPLGMNEPPEPPEAGGGEAFIAP